MKKTVISLLLVVLLLLGASCGIIADKSNDVEVLSTYSSVLSGPGGVGIQMKFTSEVEGAKFYLTANDGELFADKNSRDFSTKVTLESGEKIYWDNITEDGEVFDGKTTYVDYTVKDGDVIVGYGVIKVQRDEHATYSATVIESKNFPKVGDKYQEITQEYVDGQIAKAKNATK